MANETNKRDPNRITTVAGVGDDVSLDIIQLRLDPTTKRLKTTTTISGGVTIGGITTPTIYNLTLTLANTEYSQLLTTDTKQFRFRCRTLYDIRYAYVTGKVATPTAPYLTLPAGCDFSSDSNDLTATTVYFASAQAGVVVEIECWTE